MNLKVWGAQSLSSFTKCIVNALTGQGVNCGSSSTYEYGLVQIHGAPAALEEDKLILKESLNAHFPLIYLIHRPDELLESSTLMELLNYQKSKRFCLLGDLVFRLPFWQLHRLQCTVIPHPFMDITMPPPSAPFVVGSYTSWGEMRKLEHYLALVDNLRSFGKFEFKVGGSGIDKRKLPTDVLVSEKFFVPHFNVQLYHLFGKKRLGESSGSLHKGISVPVIFEANGAERIENFFAIKIRANDKLLDIDFAGASVEIKKMVDSNLILALEHNQAQAMENSPDAFAKALLKIFFTLK